MAFLKVPTKPKLVFVDELPWWAFTKEERDDLRNIEGFYMYHPEGGYYKTVNVPILPEYSE